MFDDMIADMESNQKLRPSVTEYFQQEENSVFHLFFISQSYFKVSKTITLNPRHYFIMKVPNKREIQQIVSNHSSDIDFKDFIKHYKEYTKEPYLFLVNDVTLSVHNPLRFRMNLS